MAKIQPCLAAAIEYLARGWSVIPLCPPDHQRMSGHHETSCKSPGKAPLLPWEDYQRRLPRAAEVRLWWDRWPGANVGVCLGPVSGLLGVDIDGPEGEALLIELIGGEENLAPTLKFRTGGGVRYLFAHPAEEVPNRSFKDAAGKEILRIQGRGCQTVMPPSIHASGRVYEYCS